MVPDLRISIEDRAEFEVVFKADGIDDTASLNFFDREKTSNILRIVAKFKINKIAHNFRIREKWGRECPYDCKFTVGNELKLIVAIDRSNVSITGRGIEIPGFCLPSGFSQSDLNFLNLVGAVTVRRVDINLHDELIRRPAHRRVAAPPKVRILHFLHEASRTGAPLILLRIVEHFSRYPSAENIVFCAKGGALIASFRELAATVELDNGRALGLDDFDVIGSALDLFQEDGRPCVALFNSLVVLRYLQPFVKANIPIVYLVHELASAFQPTDLLSVYESARSVVYPARFVQRIAWEFGRVPLPLRHKESVLPQGLLDARFGTMDRAQARKALRDELAMPADALVVLGCGSLDQRKGIDLFVAGAIATLNQWDRSRPLVFVWVGTGPTRVRSPQFYAEIDVRNAEYEKEIRFLGERENTEPYFMGSDAFFLSSREDPFPCVVHEAMASALPVIAFSGGGGAPEALSDGAGVVVPHGDVSAAAAELGSLLRSSERRAAIGSVALKRVREVYRFEPYCEAIANLLGSASGLSIENWTGALGHHEGS